MEDKKKFIEFEILKSKAKICDYERLVREEEKRLQGLYGALETLTEIEGENTKLDNRKYDDIANKKLSGEI